MARPGFIIDDIDIDMVDGNAEESDEEDELFDSVCAFCDNGGNLVWYEIFFLLVDLISSNISVLYIYVIVDSFSRA